MLHWIPFIFLVVFILVYSTDLLTGKAVCDEIHDVAVAVKPDTEESGMAYTIPYVFRKIAHASVFLLLGLASYPLVARGEKGQWLAYIVCAATALGSELLQAATPARSPEVRDVVLNLASCSAGFGWVCFASAWLPASFRKLIAIPAGLQSSLGAAASPPGDHVRLTLAEILEAGRAAPPATQEPQGGQSTLSRPDTVSP